MKVILNIDDVAEQNIVPVKCGHETGTAFFIDSQHLLTACHVVVDHIIDNATPVFIIVDGNTVVCTAKDLSKNIDIALLTCVDFVNDISHFHLLASSCRKGQDLAIVGYPQEIGNCVDVFKVDVNNSRGFDDLSRGFDTMVVRTDQVGFYSYSGFSGSPVVNEFLSVVGVVTDQLHNTLGYTSIRAAKEKLIENGFNIGCNADEEDTSIFGLGKCILHIRKVQQNAGSRYTTKPQIADEETEEEILDFAGVNNKIKLEAVHSLFLDWFYRLRGKYRKHVSSRVALMQYMSDKNLTDNVIGEIEGLFHKEGDSESSYFFVNEDRKCIESVIDLIQKYFHCVSISESQGLNVYGVAGSGKTFRLCNVAEKLSHITNTYMFFGTDFFDNEDPLDTIAHKLGWYNENPFDELDNMMKRNSKYAIFIIDGINEGAGMYFWQNKLPVLMNRMKKWSNLKLIISHREYARNDVMEDVLTMDNSVRIQGFKDRAEALKIFFKHYMISAPIEDYIGIVEFGNPLFLKIFCQAYDSLSYEDRKSVNRLAIYRSYLYQRNKNVSIGADIDPRANLTSKFMYRLAEMSLSQYRCGDIPREKAKRHSYRLCPYRTWKNDLLNNTLIENLLMEYTTRGEEELITFEYDSMGDFLKADRLLNRKCDDHDKMITLLSLCKVLYDKKDHQTDKNKIFNFIVSFLSVWNPNKDFWNKQDFLNGMMTGALLSSISLRSIRDKHSTLESSVIAKILQLNPNYLGPDLILKNFNVYKTNLLNEVHNTLKNMTMAERDFIWSTDVNKLYDGEQYIDLLGSITLSTDEDKQRLLIIECWMLTTSYPSIRNYLIRKIENQLESGNIRFIFELIDMFHEVNDPYIMQGIYSAIYGVLLNSREVDLALEVSKRIIQYHYPESGIAPNDYVLRHWTLKILEWGGHITGNSSFWDLAQPPYNAGENPFVFSEDDLPDDFFGNTQGAKALNNSLFYSDFYRYVIGGNSTKVSRDFEKTDGSKVCLKDIAKAIAYLIRNEYGWNDDLGNYDAQVPYESRHSHNTERIGKKYQWLGLSQVYAYLLDTCKVKLDVYCDTERFAEVNYPWFVGNKIYFDPSLKTDVAANIVGEIFDELTSDTTIEMEAQQWVDDSENMPSLQFIQTDKNGDEWVVLQGYDTKLEEDDENFTRERFVYYNTCLVEDIYINEFTDWSREMDFYGRWMPEATGSIEFLWSEYPWASSFKVLNYGEEIEVRNRCPAKVKLPYNAQLQEDYSGISEGIASTTYMPSKEIMTFLNLYTAERGIVREKESNKIIAINRQISGESFHGLLIRREALNQYLKSTRECLFYNIFGEKSLRLNNYNIASFHPLTGAALYKKDGIIDEIQPLRFEPTSEDSTLIDDLKPPESISPEFWLSLQGMDKKTVLDAITKSKKEK